MHDSGGEGERGGMTYIVIRRPYAHLEDEVRRVFAGREDVKVIVDRRSGERRATQQPVKVDQRRADRRRAREELVEVLIAEGSAGSSPLHHHAVAAATVWPTLPTVATPRLRRTPASPIP